MLSLGPHRKQRPGTRAVRFSVILGTAYIIKVTLFDGFVEAVDCFEVLDGGEGEPVGTDAEGAAVGFVKG